MLIYCKPFRFEGKFSTYFIYSAGRFDLYSYHKPVKSDINRRVNHIGYPESIIH